MKKNFLLTAISIISRLSTSFLLFILFARFWGPVDYGIFAYVFSITAVAVLVIEFGLQNYLLREISFKPKLATFFIRDSLWLKIVFMPLYLILTLVIFGVHDDEAMLLLAIPLIIATCVLSFADFFIAPLRAFERYDLETYTVIFNNIFQLLVLVVYLIYGAGPVEIAWMLVLTRIVQLVISVVIMKMVIKEINFKFPGFHKIKHSFLHSLPYGLDGFITTLWTQMDIILVRYMYGVHLLGLYSAGQRTIQAASALAPIIGNVMIPRLTTSSDNSKEKWKSNKRICIFIMALSGLMLSLPLIIFNELVVLQLFGSDYMGLAELLPYFGMLVFVRFMASAFGILLTGAGMQSHRVGIQIWGLALFAISSMVIFYFELNILYLISSLIACFLVIGFGYMWKLRKYGY
jgi:O-antigen/teichoic acid export membrane protein